MSDLPATRAEAEALVRRLEQLYVDEWKSLDVDSIIALARLGARVLGASDAWCVLHVSGPSGEMFPTKEMAESARIRGPRDLVRRVIVLAGEGDK